MKTLTRAKGGTAQRVIPLDTVQVPDLWHVAAFLRRQGEPRAAAAVLECWSLAHDMLRALRDDDAGKGVTT